MILAELNEYTSTEKVLGVLDKAFENIVWGDQGTIDMPDAYFWITEGGVKVKVDNFCSNEFQVKCVDPNEPLIVKVISILSSEFTVNILSAPKLEPHE